MAGNRSIDLQQERGDALWREERRRTDVALGAARRARPSQRHLRRGIGAGMAVTLALVGLAVTMLLLRLFWAAGSWFAETIMPHFLRHDAVPAATAETLRAVSGALGWLLGVR